MARQPCRLPTRRFARAHRAFLEGHEQAFDVRGGTPVEHIRYDNLKAAVSRVLFGRNRVESARWVDVDPALSVLEAHQVAHRTVRRRT